MSSSLLIRHAGSWEKPVGEVRWNLDSVLSNPCRSLSQRPLRHSQVQVRCCMHCLNPVGHPAWKHQSKTNRLPRISQSCSSCSTVMAKVWLFSSCNTAASWAAVISATCCNDSEQRHGHTVRHAVAHWQATAGQLQWAGNRKRIPAHKPVLFIAKAACWPLEW